MTDDAARILDVLLPAENIPDRLRRVTARLPDIDRQDQGVATRMVVEDDLDRCIGVEAAVPIGLAIDVNGRKPRRQSARRHHMLQADWPVAAVEVVHFAGTDVHSTDSQTNVARASLEFDQFPQSGLERL